MTSEPLRQILYASVCGDGVDLDDILQQSRHNNAVDGITGLLWADGGHFLQVLEGPADSVATAYARIAADPRHRNIRILSDRSVDAREFGYWSMERGPACSDPALRERLARRLSNAPADIRAVFANILASD